MRDKLFSYYRDFGYSPHGLVAISEKARGWEATRARGAVAYLEVGRTWLASEPLASARDLATVTEEFVEHSRNCGRLCGFVPATERLARVGVAMGLDCVPIGAAPYFDLERWKPEGRRLRTVRKELNKARRQGVSVECVPAAALPRNEVRMLEKAWVESRRATGFSWVFAPDTAQFGSYRKFFLARAASGELVGLLNAAPLPARKAYYFKDLHRHPDAPKGTTDLLMVTAIEQLRSEGVQFITPGPVPIRGISDPHALSAGNNLMLMRAMKFVERTGEPVYGFSGIQVFKSRFRPTWWEHEYSLSSRVALSGIRVGLAAVRATAPTGVLKAIWGGTWRR